MNEHGRDSAATPRGVFTYRVVSHNGAGVHASFSRLSDARTAAAHIAGRHDWGPVEIERVQHLDGGLGGWPRRYWLRQRKRWVAANPKLDTAEREPDMVWYYARRDSDASSDARGLA